jgi:violaxanthin de-epoxidase
MTHRGVKCLLVLLLALFISGYGLKLADVQTIGKKWLKTSLLSVAIASAATLQNPTPSIAADTVKVGTCLLKSCQKELAQCILNPKCLANVICINSCNGRPDESECQIGCGDLFENDVVGVFNNCAVSQKKCVPRKVDVGVYPLPSPESQVKKFDTSIWNGRWYITAGLNKVFDTFDCQVHFFTSPSPGTFFAKLFWRITEPDGEFFTKNAVQKFVQDKSNPAHLINHDNEYLHYKDDWYIIDYEPDDFVLVYYMGSNDAWDGYGGSFLYTRSPTLRPELIPRLEKAVDKMNLKYKWKDYALTDNSCQALKESPTVLREKFAKRLLITEEQQLQEQLTSLRAAAVNTIQAEEGEAAKTIQFLEKEVAAFEKELVRDAVQIEKAVENTVERTLESVEEKLIK